MQVTLDRRCSFLVLLSCAVFALSGCGGGVSTLNERDSARASAESDATTVMEAAGLESSAKTSMSEERPCNRLTDEELSPQEWFVEYASDVDPDSAQALIERVVGALSGTDGWDVVGDGAASPVWPLAGIILSHGDGLVTLAIDVDSGEVSVSASSGCYGAEVS